MRLFALELEGRTPLLQKRKDGALITKEALAEDHPLRAVIKGDVITTQDLKRIEVQKAVADFLAYRNGNGIYQPAATWRHSFIEGARKAKVKMGRSSIWKLLQGTMFPAPAEPLITRNGEELRNPEIGPLGVAMCYDTLFRSLVRGTVGVVQQFQARIELPWDCNMMVLVQDENIPETTLKEIVSGAGLYAGIGSWISGGFGRYELMKLKEVDAPSQKEMLKLMQPV